jgi:hypothetical protein
LTHSIQVAAASVPPSLHLPHHITALLFLSAPVFESQQQMMKKKKMMQWALEP